MGDQRTIKILHLPTKGQTLFYILTLIASPLLNLGVNSLVYHDAGHTAHKAKELFPLLHHALGLSGFLLGIILVLLGVNIAQALVLRHRKSRRSLLAFGIASSLYFVVNLLTISYGIVAFDIQSYLLLIISIGVYFSVNIIFLFWNWYIDYPTQIKAIHHADSEREIEFPEYRDSRPPSFVDYLYYTLISSNTLGSPENHSPNGTKAKITLMLHSMTMMLLLVVFVSRAINTLS